MVSIGKQFKVLKDNWLIVIALIFVVLLLSNFRIDNISTAGVFSTNDASFKEMGAGTVPNYFGNDFAPDVETRKIIYSASVNVEVDKGDFLEVDDKFEGIVRSREGIVLNKNLNSYGESERKIGYYSLRVDVRNLDALLNDLKELGEVKGFSKDAYDVTGSYLGLEERLKIESEKLVRLKSFLNEATSINDKILLNEQISEQERTIEYLQEALQSQDEQIEYATVSFTLEEKESEFANITFVTFGELVKSFVDSIAGLLRLTFVLIPYVFIIFIIWIIFKKKK
ncbi:hypothetical protein AUJ84_04345 [Candidatus Pacearchaeota archaeon CG1_02_32_132]|nr:MAG: hypothetical protein AUJ84_04345 [Candidatus Pacearchaeota archaeon CG1_02_32_132]